MPRPAINRPSRREAIRPRVVPSGRWLLISLGLLVTQGVAGVVMPGDGLVTTAGLIAQCLLAVVFALRRASGSTLRGLWLALAAGLACWAAGYVAIAVEERLIGPQPGVSLVDDVLFVLKAAPFLLLLTAGLDFGTSRGLLRLDLAGAFVFVVLATVLMLGDPFGSGQRAGDYWSAVYRDVENLLLAGLGIAATLAQRRAADRAFYRAIAVLLTAYAIITALLDHAVIGRPSDAPGWWLAVGAVPFVLFHLAGRRPPARSRIMVRALPLRHFAPALLTAGSLLIAFAVAARDDPSGIVLGMLALAIYAWRSTVVQLASSSANASLRREGRQLAALALTDPLTGVANRRRFDQALAACWDEAGRLERFVTVLLIDVDWFKLLNDVLGHAAGDAGLQMLARALDDAVGHGATFARLGGEEFGVVAALDPAAALALAEALRACAETLDIVHPASPLGHVTVCVGVATGVPGRDVRSPSALIASADAALYAAKAGGRNRVGGGGAIGAAGSARAPSATVRL